jgi:hypothetical protein
MSLENKIELLIKALEKNTDALLNASTKPKVQPVAVEPEPEPVAVEPEPVAVEPEPVVEKTSNVTIEDCRVVATYLIKIKKDKAALSSVLKKNGVTNLTSFTGDASSFLKDLEDAAGVKLENCPN